MEMKKNEEITIFVSTSLKSEFFFNSLSFNIKVLLKVLFECK